MTKLNRMAAWLLALTLLLTAACAPALADAQAKPTTEIIVDKKELTLAEGKSDVITMQAMAIGSADDLGWKRGNDDLISVKVKNDKKNKKVLFTVKALHFGQTYLYLKSGVPDVRIPITITPKPISLKEGKSAKTTWMVKKEDVVSEQILDEKVATFTKKESADKIVYTVKALSYGNTSLKLVGKTGEINIPISVSPKKPLPAELVSLDKSEITLEKGKSLKLTATTGPEFASTKVTWKSDNKKVAAVSSKGKVTAKKEGTAIITVKTKSGVETTCKVTVLPKGGATPAPSPEASPAPSPEASPAPSPEVSPSPEASPVPSPETSPTAAPTGAPEV